MRKGVSDERRKCTRTRAPPSRSPFWRARSLQNAQLRRNVRHATDVIQGKRGKVVAEDAGLGDLSAGAGKAIRHHTMRFLNAYLEEFEANVTRAGGVVHWARDAAEATSVIVRLTQEAIARGESDTPVFSPGTTAGAGEHKNPGAPRIGEVLKIKSMTTEEIQLNRALEAAGIHPV